MAAVAPTAPVAGPSEQRVVLRNVSWETYQRLVDDDPDRRVPRMAYDRGVLEIVSPSPRHERDGAAVEQVVGIVAEESGIDYDVDVIWDSVAVGVDFHPTRGALRLFAGIMRNDNRLEARGRIGDEITIGGTDYEGDAVGV